MKTVTIGSLTYRIPATERDGQWIARAERTERAIDWHRVRGRYRRGCWLRGTLVRGSANTWRRSKICSVPNAPPSHDRRSAFASPPRTGAIEMQKRVDRAVEAARIRLDEIRARRPNRRDPRTRYRFPIDPLTMRLKKT